MPKTCIFHINFLKMEILQHHFFAFLNKNFLTERISNNFPTAQTKYRQGNCPPAMKKLLVLLDFAIIKKKIS